MFINLKDIENTVSVQKLKFVLAFLLNKTGDFCQKSKKMLCHDGRHF